MRFRDAFRRGGWPVAMLALFLFAAGPASGLRADGAAGDPPDAGDEEPSGAAGPPPDPLQPLWDARAGKQDELKAKLPELVKALKDSPDAAAKAAAAVRLALTQAAVGDFEAAIKICSETAKGLPESMGEPRFYLYGAWFRIARRTGKADVLRAAAEAARAALADQESEYAAEHTQLAEMQLEYVDRVGQAMAEFSGKTIQGPEFKLSEKKGRLVFVHFWGVW